MMSDSTVRAEMDKFALRIERTIAFLGDDVPDYFDVAAGRWCVNGGWTEGFWPGLLWRLQAQSPGGQLTAHARRATRLVARLKAETDDHDLGFLFLPSCVLEHELTGDLEMVPAAIAAAERLAARYRCGGRYIPAHGPVNGPNAGFAIIDTVMNLPLLHWAAEQAGSARFAEIAIETARTIAREHVRPDGSSCQVLWLDPDTGRTLRRDAVMAASVDSCWSRGHAWGVHGYARMYQLTGAAEFRRVAKAMAGYFLSRLPEDGLVFHDLDDPAIPAVPRDSSAQAIAAGGLLILAETSEGRERGQWMAAGERLLNPLLDRCLVADAPGATPPRGFLGQACKSLRKNQGLVSEIVFGDYYLVGALQHWLALKRAANG